MGKKAEMLQVYSGTNEFIFGENGGRGKHLTSFLKNLSLTGSGTGTGRRRSQSPHLDEGVNTSIYGSFGYGQPERPGDRPAPHRSASTGRATLGAAAADGGDAVAGRTARQKYADLDDDWDADIEPARRAAVGTPAAASADDAASGAASEAAGGAAAAVATAAASKLLKFSRTLSPDSIDLAELRKLLWNGIPHELRALAWQLLLGYLPANKLRQASTLQRKRQEYLEGLRLISPHIAFDEDSLASAASLPGSLSNDGARDKQLYHQINIDVKRTNPKIALYGRAATQELLRKILFLWAVRHPASGYVQGINDLCTPFYQIFLADYVRQVQRRAAAGAAGAAAAFGVPGLALDDPEEAALRRSADLPRLCVERDFDPARLLAAARARIEADTYWCLSRLLENITDNYIHQQPGILRQVQELRNLTAKIDVELLQHFDREGIEFMQFAFRWMNCLLMRELSLALIVRMWDTYLSEVPLGFNHFHVYVCAAFLIKFSDELKQMDFQEILLFLQNPPTQQWRVSDVELMLSEAFIWQSLYKNAAAHLR
jgi:hypothetical protein